MYKSPWFTKLAKLFGVTPKVKSFPYPMAKVLRGRLGKRSDFRYKSMRRGVQVARELRQRPRRLAWIAESCRQGIEIARRRYRAQKMDREHGGHLHMVAFRRSCRGI